MSAAEIAVHLFGFTLMCFGASLIAWGARNHRTNKGTP